MAKYDDFNSATLRVYLFLKNNPNSWYTKSELSRHCMIGVIVTKTIINLLLHLGLIKRDKKKGTIIKYMFITDVEKAKKIIDKLAMERLEQ